MINYKTKGGTKLNNIDIKDSFANDKIIKEEDDCPTCGEKIYYSVVYDAYFCISCDKWLEKACRNPRCRFCADRPIKPSGLREAM